MKIIFLDEYSVGTADLTPIKALGEYVGYDFTKGADEVVARAQGAEVIISNKVQLSREVLEQLPNLKLVCIAATGMNNIDLEAAHELGIEVRNAIGYSTYSVAEATLASTLSLLRQTTYYDQYIKSGEYSKSERLFCFDRPIGQLRGKNWGIIGLGGIGREVSRLAAAFGCDVRYFSTSGAQREEATTRAENLVELLEWGDIISIHAPLNEQTRGLIGEAELRTMRNNAILINVARGGIIDEAALAEALNRGEIAAAALDVFSNEPLEPTSPLLSIEDTYKLTLSPHNAWSSTDSVERLIAAIAENIKSCM